MNSFLIPAFLLLFMASCVKEYKKTFTDFSEVQDKVILQGAGLNNFKASNIRFSRDTMKYEIYATLAGVNAPGSPINVTLGLDDSKRTAYNAANGTAFQVMPSNAYKISSTALTIPAGQHHAKTTVEIYRAKLDPTVSYMLPISITDASGKGLSSNQNTIYYNFIGNPLAGDYLWDFIRYQAGDTTIAPHSSSFYGKHGSPVPSGPTSLVFPESYLQTFADPAAGITLSFTNNNGVLSNFSVSFDQTTLKGLEAGGFTIVSLPKLVSFSLGGNAANAYKGTTFRVYYSLINSTGAGRTFINHYIKQ